MSMSPNFNEAKNVSRQIIVDTPEGWFVFDRTSTSAKILFDQSYRCVSFVNRPVFCVSQIDNWICYKESSGPKLDVVSSSHDFNVRGTVVSCFPQANDTWVTLIRTVSGYHIVASNSHADVGASCVGMHTARNQIFVYSIEADGNIVAKDWITGECISSRTFPILENGSLIECYGDPGTGPLTVTEVSDEECHLLFFNLASEKWIDLGYILADQERPTVGSGDVIWWSMQEDCLALMHFSLGRTEPNVLARFADYDSEVPPSVPFLDEQSGRVIVSLYSDSRFAYDVVEVDLSSRQIASYMLPSEMHARSVAYAWELWR